ncbi:hypothetical protein RCH13_001819 [Chryseobacterium sp. MP_3.2]|nr:hypothetical protein [Chryseobacterium sp. MP_3.2]
MILRKWLSLLDLTNINNFQQVQKTGIKFYNIDTANYNLSTDKNLHIPSIHSSYFKQSISDLPE